MAIIGNLHKIKHFLNKKDLDIVFDYFIEATSKNSDIYKRIFNSPVGTFEKIAISENIFTLEQVFYTKDRENCFIESHKNYIDFQLIIQGNEQMEYIDIDKIEVQNEYDEKKDLITYKLVDNTSKILLQDNDLAIFFPDDAHIGLPKFKTSELVYKTVIKLPISEWRN